MASEIASGSSFPLVGPPMRNRVHLGATYYYVWALPFLASAEPLAAYAFAGVLGVLAVALTWILARRLAGSAAAFAAALLLATQPIAVIDARIAWAPAALPPLAAALLLALVSFCERPTTARAVVVALLSALALQLHVAATPLVVVAAGFVLARTPALGARGLAAAALAGLVALFPALAALTVPTAGASEVAPSAADAWSDRLADLLRFGGRALDGLSPAGGARPAWVELLFGVESAWLAVVLVAAVVVSWRGGRSPGGVHVVVAALVATLAAVALLPWDAWYYYLDGALVPAAVVAGIAFASLGATGLGCVAVLAAVRTAVLLWWMHAAQASGFLPVDPDLLRLGGERAVEATERPRVLTFASRRDASAALADALASPGEDLRRRAHGPGFADLDSDNGYFLRRAERGAARPTERAPSTGPKPPLEAAVLYAGEVPAAWRAALPEPVVAGPLEVVAYAPSLDLGGAFVDGCEGGRQPLPAPPVRDPLAYGSGEPARSAWPCRSPTVVATLRPAATPDASGRDPGVTRVFARVDGAGRVARIESVPAGTPIAAEASGRLGSGIELRGLPAVVRVQLDVHGPATLDLFELRGE